jgi:large conductance mechanosensitive channel
MSWVSEFREFAVKGNVVDLAVGVIIGGAFGKIVSSLVGDVVMPLVGTVLGGLDFSGLMVEIGSAKIQYGKFIQNVVDFCIIALVIFLMVRAINHFRRKHEHEAPAAPPPRQEQLLEDIRDQLKQLTSAQTSMAQVEKHADELTQRQNLLAAQEKKLRDNLARLKNLMDE